jgi:hypothetical protein
MTTDSPFHTVVATYRVKADQLDAFMELLKEHHPTLLRLGLATDEIPIIYYGTEDDGAPIVFEIFTWVDGDAPGKAHHAPEVGRIWEAMGSMTEERKFGPQFQFPHVARHVF